MSVSRKTPTRVPHDLLRLHQLSSTMFRSRAQRLRVARQSVACGYAHAASNHTNLTGKRPVEERNARRVRLRPGSSRGELGPIYLSWDHLGTRMLCFMASFGRAGSVRATESSELMERAMGIEIIATWFFKDLRSRARTDLEGLGSLRNP